jgi:hypothetical protein
MTLLLLDSLLAARTGFLGSPSARIGAWMVGLIVVLGAAWGASIISGAMRRKQRAKQSTSSKKCKDVFDEICQAHGLSSEEKRQLRGAATILDLLSPALLFVDSGLLNKLATSDRDDAGEFRKLANRLFPPNDIPSESDLAELTENPATV